MEAVCENYETSPLSSKDKALFAYLAKVNDTPGSIRKDDVAQAQAAGWSDATLFDAITVCAIFNFFNRWIDGIGVPDVPRAEYDAAVAARGGTSYAM